MTYAELLQAIEDYVENYEATFIANIPLFVKQAEKRIYNAVQLPVAREASTGTLTSGNRFLSMPDGFLSVHSLDITDGSGVHHYPVFKDVEWLREAFPDPTVEGIPDYYAMFDNNTLILSAVPDANYTVELHYYKYPASIVDAGTSWVGDNFDFVLLYGSLVEAYTFMKGEDELLGFCDAKFKEGIGQLKNFAEGKNRQDTYSTQQTRQRVS